MIITIDGLGVNGKTTLAKMLAKRLGYVYLNTGAIYRCITLYILDNDITDYNNITNVKIDFKGDDVFLNNINVSDRIIKDDISLISTKIATNKEIKEIVRNMQRKILDSNRNIIIEGRDIATRIAPNADIKFYLYSDFDVRVKRLSKNKNIKYYREDLIKRDKLDIYGGNFIKPSNAIEIDTSNLSIDKVYDKMMNEINKIRRKLC